MNNISTNYFIEYQIRDPNPAPLPGLFSLHIANIWWLQCHLLYNVHILEDASSLIVSPVRSTYGEYYGLVVVTPPRPQTLQRSHDNLKNPYRIASILYM